MKKTARAVGIKVKDNLQFMVVTPCYFDDINYNNDDGD